MARPREFDEEAVVRAARERFWDAGYAATSMTDLSEATGVGKTSLYGAFGDKHALFMRIFDEYSTGAVKSAEAELDGSDAGAFERIRAYLLANASGSAGNPRGCLLARGTSELANADPEVAARAKCAYEGLSAVFARAVEGAQRAGDLDPSTDPRAVGDLILAVHRGTEALGRGGAEEPALRTLVETFLASLRSR
ncbi:TetR/AcrR family transcriptional regulator [Solirubrobacter ginsenosidimutans]|uniref:TetR/AcrR family transcriptional regulator n=1 Tax=Solirubrobacter ginsenosidimutans TaxID=490573 RepID=A0A9X3S0Q4_9ACTN|nr:TetR/AcrR family transcriptional regulator [Solirubrobacter ginsenosidimutans]MDA0161564.1 TetR/AcrR family transcriptional regulator [Solirubrobacter ginsenosidimutans]